MSNLRLIRPCRLGAYLTIIIAPYAVSPILGLLAPRDGESTEPAERSHDDEGENLPAHGPDAAHGAKMGSQGPTGPIGPMWRA
jgi:hypothetical protein